MLPLEAPRISSKGVKMQWKTIIYKDIETFYEVSNDGQVRNKKTNYILKSRLKSNGYYEYNIYVDGKKIFIPAHKIVASAFLSPIEGKTIVNHKNGNKEDNRVENLEYVDFSGNNKHAWDNNLNHANALRKIEQYNLQGELIAVFESVAEAKRVTGASKIREVANGERKTSGGFIWKWAEDFIPKDIGRKKQVKQKDLSGVEIAIFESVSEASRATGANRQGISAVCKGKQFQCGGFLWEYC